MTETLAHGYSSECSAFQRIPMRQGLDGFQNDLRPCALDESSPSIGRVNGPRDKKGSDNFGEIFQAKT